MKFKKISNIQLYVTTAYIAIIIIKFDQVCIASPISECD